MEILFHNLSFSYSTASADLLADLTLHFPVGWTGVVGANGAGKTTILRLATGELKPLAGHVQTPAGAIYCPQRTDEPPQMLAQMLADVDSEASQLKGHLNIAADWLQRWSTLSHGERKRAQIGVALWHQPQVLAVDEPTNHIDAAARDLLAGALHSFYGVGLLVSHDRDLLDALCRQCLFVDPPEAVLRPGGFTEGSQRAEMDREYAQEQRQEAKREVARLEREAVQRRREASNAHKKRSKRGLGKDNDARFQRNLARATGKDGTDGKLLRQLDGRLEKAHQKQEEFKVKKTYELGIWLPDGRSHRNTLFRLAAGALPLGDERRLAFPDLAMQPDERIALTGPNGGGKSTLVRQLVQSLDLPENQVTYMPQEIGATEAQGIIEEVHRLPKDQLGQMMNVVSRLGSRPGRLLESGLPSPGEIRKILLALGIARGPHLIVMDEPTNHLDLPSIECLEQALDDCPCGLFLVSHDHRFLERLTKTCWHIAQQPAGHMELQTSLRPA